MPFTSSATRRGSRCTSVSSASASIRSCRSARSSCCCGPSCWAWCTQSGRSRAGVAALRYFRVVVWIGAGALGATALWAVVSGQWSRFLSEFGWQPMLEMLLGAALLLFTMVWMAMTYVSTKLNDERAVECGDAGANSTSVTWMRATDHTEAHVPDVLDRLGRETLILEGAMGTMLQRAGMLPGHVSRDAQRHRARDGGRRPPAVPARRSGLHHDQQLRGLSAQARRARLRRPGRGVQPRGGPGGARVGRAPHPCRRGADRTRARPIGEATFDELFDIFAEQVVALAAEKPDAIFFETFTDIAEVRCGILAARSVTDLPVLASVTFGANGAHGPLGYRSRDSGGDPRGRRGVGRRDELRPWSRADGAAGPRDGRGDDPAGDRPAERGDAPPGRRGAHRVPR